MEDGDADELAPAARWYVDVLANSDEPGRAPLLKELWAREDGPLETRLAGHDGEALVVPHIRLELYDTVNPAPPEPGDPTEGTIPSQVQADNPTQESK